MMSVLPFDKWTASRDVHAIGTNFKSEPIPFQSWKKFKEAFAPELIHRAVLESQIPVARILDPFGGSGTTALAAQFLGIHPITIEVNPFLADLIEAKLRKYDVPRLSADVTKMINAVSRLRFEPAATPGTVRWLPPTFIEPGKNGRWLFSKTLFDFLERVLGAAALFEEKASTDFIRVIIGGTLVHLSNVRVSGKGRRYRSSWNTRETTVDQAANAITDALRSALSDITNHNERACETYELERGDARGALAHVEPVDLAVFSPPYPNSFDYTDVYNVELWILGYLKDMEDNRTLRSSTLTSHVQIKREYAAAPLMSASLDTTMGELRAVEDELWSPHIPAMIGSYFHEMTEILRGTKTVLKAKGQAWLVVGDSRYAKVDVPVAQILSEIATSLGYTVVMRESFRSMRTSPQQGGLLDLDETLLVFQKG